MVSICSPVLGLCPGLEDKLQEGRGLESSTLHPQNQAEQSVWGHKRVEGRKWMDE